VGTSGSAARRLVANFGARAPATAPVSRRRREQVLIIFQFLNRAM